MNSIAVTNGIGAALGCPDADFFDQVYENKSTVNRMVSASRKKGNT